MTSADIRYKAVIILLLIHCLLLLPLHVCVCFVMYKYSTQCLFLFCNHLSEVEIAV